MTNLTPEGLRERAEAVARQTPIVSMADMLFVEFTMLVDAAVDPWECRAASLADALNTELRENGPLGVLQVKPDDDMREAIRRLVDLVREYGQRRVAEAREAGAEWTLNEVENRGVPRTTHDVDAFWRRLRAQQETP